MYNMPTKALTVIHCDPITGKAVPLDFSKRNQILKMGNIIITLLEFSGNTAQVFGYKPDESKVAIVLHLHSSDKQSLEQFVQ